MNRRLAVLAFVFAAFAVLAGATVGCYAPSQAEQQSTNAAGAEGAAAVAVVRVVAAKPARKSLRLETAQPGQIQAFEQTPLFAKLPGFVEKLHVDIGDRVEAGRVLVDLSIPELQEECRQKEAAVAQARAGVEQAAAALRAARAAAKTAQAKVGEARAGTIRAAGDLARWTSQHKRYSELAAGGSVDQRLVDEALDARRAAEAARDEAAAKVESAKAALQENQANIEKATADETAAHARLQSAQADLARQKALLGYTQIRAPFAGTITERNVDRGHFVQPAGVAGAKPLLAVHRTDTVRVFVEVPETEAPWVEPGDKGYLRIQALRGRELEGQVTRTGWALGANRTLRTEIDLPNPDGLLRPGMYATARIVLDERRDVLALPVSAVVREGKEAFCFTVRQGRAARRPIVLGLQAGDEVEVAAGLSGDELVVLARPDSLKEGQPVEPTH